MLRIKRHIALSLFFLVVIVGFVLSLSIGPAWDEPDNIFSAGVYVNFFQNHFDPEYFRILTDKASAYGDRITPNDHLIARYPPIPNYVGVLFVFAAQALHIPDSAQVIIIAWHFGATLFFALMVAMTYRFGILLGLSVISSLFAAFGVFLYPQLFGYGFSNLKDTAQVAMVITSLYYLVRATKDVLIKKKDLFTGAFLWGLGMATKFNAIYVPIIWGIWYIFTTKKNRLFTLYYLLVIGIVGLVTTYMVWPYLWFDTGNHLVEVVKYFTTVGQGYRVVWNGILYNMGTGKSLWWYPLLSFLYMTPLFLFFLIIFGGIILAYNRKKNPTWMILPIWIFLPFMRTMSPWSAFYDQMRHFLEIIPALLLVAAIGFERLGKLSKWVCVSAVVGQLMIINIVFFPYSAGYYNVLARAANTNFDRDITGLSIKEGMDWLHHTYGEVDVWVPIAAHLSWPYLTPHDRYIYELKDNPDTIIISNKQTHGASGLRDLVILNNYSLVHTISRGGAIFGWIYRKTVNPL